ncbi:MAG: hypothetical protein AB7K24_31930, partial [Gemmataceae bacterium]
TRQWLERWMARTFFVHPEGNRFSSAEFVAELERHGLQVNNNMVERARGDFVFGMARRRGKPLSASAAAAPGLQVAVEP